MGRVEVVGGEDLLKPSDARYVLKLYIAGPSPASLQAMVNARSILERNLAGRFDLEVVDLRLHPEIAARDDVIFAPVLVKRLPLPLRKIVGELGDEERVLLALDVKETRP